MIDYVVSNRIILENGFILFGIIMVVLILCLIGLFDLTRRIHQYIKEKNGEEK